MKNSPIRTLFVFLSVLVSCSHAEPRVRQDIDPLDILTRATHANAESPALIAMMASEGSEPRVAVVGVRRAGEQTKATVDDLWHLGSVTKSMTATLVARLVEQQVVAWEDTVGDRLSEVAPDMLAAYRDVNFRHLLSHRSGLQANLEPKYFMAFGQKPDDSITDRAKWVALALKQKPAGEKEKNFLYSNNGFIVAGAMLEAATGKSWEALMQSHVFTPLGIDSAGFGPPSGKELNSQPSGHTSPSGGKDVPVPPGADNPAALGPAGRAHMNMHDLGLYLLAQVSHDAEFLSSESWKTLQTPPFGGDYAMGWVAVDGNTRWHNGTNTMWYAEVGFDLIKGKVAAVVVNDGDRPSVESDVSELLRALLR